MNNNDNNNNNNNSLYLFPEIMHLNTREETDTKEKGTARHFEMAKLIELRGWAKRKEH